MIPQGRYDMGNTDTPDLIRDLNLIFIQTLKCLGEAGETDAACKLAAKGWSLLRQDRPADAQRLNGVLHFLTHPVNSNRKKDK